MHNCKFECPNCGKSEEVIPSLMGTVIPCSQCDFQIMLPEPIESKEEKMIEAVT